MTAKYKSKSKTHIDCFKMREADDTVGEVDDLTPSVTKRALRNQS